VIDEHKRERLLEYQKAKLKMKNERLEDDSNISRVTINSSVNSYYRTVRILLKRVKIDTLRLVYFHFFNI
jgi:hypothetical protein